MVQTHTEVVQTQLHCLNQHKHHIIHHHLAAAHIRLVNVANKLCCELLHMWQWCR